MHLGEGTVLLHAEVGAVLVEGALDGGEVGQRTTEPAVHGEGHAGRLSGLAHDFLRLRLGGDEEHFLALGGGVLDEGGGGGEARVRLLKVDDRNTVAVIEDERTAAGIPATGLVSEVDAGIEEVFDCDVHIFGSVSLFLQKEGTLDQGD